MPIPGQTLQGTSTQNVAGPSNPNVSHVRPLAGQGSSRGGHHRPQTGNSMQHIRPGQPQRLGVTPSARAIAHHRPTTQASAGRVPSSHQSTSAFTFTYHYLTSGVQTYAANQHTAHPPMMSSTSNVAHTQGGQPAAASSQRRTGFEGFIEHFGLEDTEDRWTETMNYYSVT